jgi:hypothetical protein
MKFILNRKSEFFLFINLLLMIQFYIPWEGEGAMMKNNNPGLVFYQKKILDPFFFKLII